MDTYAEQRDHLLQSIEQDEQQVRVAMHELTGAARVRFNMVERIRQRPLICVVGACLVGVWLGSRGTRVRVPRPRS